MWSPSRVRAADLALFACAWWLRVGWMGQLGRLHADVDPSSLRSVRQAFDGHERLLFEAFLGQPPTPSPQAWPLAVAVHRALGLVTHDPRALLVLAGTLGAVTTVAVAVAVRRRWGPQSGLMAGALVALLPEHVAWSTSAVPVVHGLACLAAAFAVRSVPLRAVLAALAAGLRPELALPALFLGPAGAAAVATALLQLVLVGRPPGADLLAVWQVNLPLVGFVGPAVLGLALLGLRDRSTGLLAGLALTIHTVGAMFSDYGARHALPAGIALCALAAAHPKRRWLPVVVAMGLLPELIDLRSRWHHRDVEGTVDAPRTAALGCVEVSDEPPVPGQPMPSWVSLVDGTLDAPCVVWGEAPEHTEWASRGLRDRALRMRWTWELSPVQGGARPPVGPWRQTWLLAAGPGVRGTMGTLPERPVP